MPLSAIVLLASPYRVNSQVETMSLLLGLLGVIRGSFIFLTLVILLDPKVMLLRLGLIVSVLHYFLLLKGML